MKSFSSIRALLLMISAAMACSHASAQAKNKLRETELYKGIEFEMPKVNEPVFPANQVSIVQFGAVSGGMDLCTSAFAAAIDAVAAKGGGRVVIPRGTWLTGPITLKSNVEIYAESGSLVIFSKDKSLYPIVESTYEGIRAYRCMSPINGRNLENIAFTGQGIYDGSGDVWRAVKKEKLTESQWKGLVASGGVVNEKGNTWYPSEQFRAGERLAGKEAGTPRTKEDFEKVKDFLRPVMLSLVSCKKVLLDGPTFMNSPAWCIHPLMCTDLTVRNITVRNPWYSQNGDGIDIESCKNTLLYDSNFDCGDDAICIKSGKDKEGRDRGIPTENLVIKNCVVYHGHGGVTIGSEMSGGVKNLHASGCTFLGTDVGLRFKSNRGRGGVVENIYMSDIEMINIPSQAISFNLFYSGRDPSTDFTEGSGGTQPALLPVTEETPAFRNIFIRNVNCNGAYQGIYLQGLPELNLENIRLENIGMDSDWGVICTDVKGLNIKGLRLVTKKFPAIDFKNSKDVVLVNCSAKEGPSALMRVTGSRSAGLNFSGAGLKNASTQVEVAKEVPAGAVKF